MASISTTPETLESGRRVRFTRRMGVAIVFIVLGAVLFIGAQNVGADTDTCLTFESGACISGVSHVIVPTQSYLLLAGLVIAGIGLGVLGNSAIQGEKNRRATQWSTVFLAIAGALLVPTILVSAAAGERTNVTTMFSESLRLATPLAIGAMAGLWCERAGVVNIAIEGMMLTSACFGFTAVFVLRRDYPDIDPNLSLLIGVMVGILSGGVAALLHAWLSITFRTDQVVSGTVINILAAGLTSFIRRDVLLSSEAGGIKTPNIAIPLISDIPIIGDELFNQQPIFYLMFLVIIVSHIVLFYTPWGLRTRAVGEYPEAADTLGINVNRTRWANVFIGGLIAGLAGAWFSLEVTGRFTDNMTRGAGFIALAALIFGKWTPFGAFAGALLFGFSQALDTRLQGLEVPLPSQFLQMLPYALTIIVLAGLVGRASGPKASGKPYVKE